jgi:hypothetical protein
MAVGTADSHEREGKQPMEAYGITVTIDCSSATDGAPVVFIDTDESLECGEGPRIRVRLNDEPIYVGVARGTETV